MKYLTPSILQVHNTIIHASINSGIPLNRLIISEIIMIQKQSNSPQINKLRVLNKLEADYNLFLKYHWTNQTTPYINLLGENQWDTRPRRSAHTTSLLDELITEIYRFLFRSLAKLKNDTASYYD